MKSITTIFFFAMAFILACNSTPTPRTPDLDSLQAAMEESDCKTNIMKQSIEYDDIMRLVQSKGKLKMYDTLFAVCDTGTCEQCKEYFDKIVHIVD